MTSLEEREFREWLRDLFAPPPGGSERMFLYRGYTFRVLFGTPNRYWVKEAEDVWKECPDPFVQLYWKRREDEN